MSTRERDVTALGEVMLRDATSADVAQVSAIEIGAFTDPWSRASFESVIGDARVAFVVATPATAPQEIIGYVVSWFVMDEGEIANLAVAPRWRRSGVASALIDLVIERATSRFVSSVYLEVRDSNVAARGLYASHGFEEVGRRKAYYRRPVEDALVLRRTLDASPGRMRE